jgi:hypothetical protein
MSALPPKRTSDLLSLYVKMSEEIRQRWEEQYLLRKGRRPASLAASVVKFGVEAANRFDLSDASSSSSAPANEDHDHAGPRRFYSPCADAHALE